MGRRLTRTHTHTHAHTHTHTHMHTLTLTHTHTHTHTLTRGCGTPSQTSPQPVSAGVESSLLAAGTASCPRAVRRCTCPWGISPPAEYPALPPGAEQRPHYGRSSRALGGEEGERKGGSESIAWISC